jgi:hypothetical protein
VLSKLYKSENYYFVSTLVTLFHKATKLKRKDTVAMYNSIQQYSKKHKYTKFYGLIFRSSNTSKRKIIASK